MNPEIRKIEADLLKLTAESRIYLAERLFESLEAEPDPEVEAAWEKEIERRIRDIETGKVKLTPADTAFREARMKLHEARRLSS